MELIHRDRSRVGLRPALALGALLIMASLLVPATILAAGNSLRIAPASTTPPTGSSFTVRIVGNSAGKISGAAASVVFDRTKLQVTALAKGANWVAAGAGFAGYPTSAHLAAFIANANAAGKVPTIGAFFVDGSSSLAAGDHDLYSVTFKVLACGTSTINLPIGPSDGGMIDGTPASYGAGLTVTSTSGGIADPCPTPKPTPTPTPTPTPAGTPGPGATPTPTPAATPTPTPAPSNAVTPTPSDSGGVAGTSATPPSVTPPVTNTLPDRPAPTSGSLFLLLIALVVIVASVVLVSLGWPSRRGR